MSRINNPIIIRLGINSFINFVNQVYGNTYVNYFKHWILQYHIFIYLHKYLQSYKYLYDSIELIWLKDQIHLNLTSLSKFNYSILKTQIRKLNLQSSIKIKSYSKSSNKITAHLIGIYSEYLLFDNLTPKRKLLVLTTLLNKSLSKCRIIYTNRGPVNSILIGYKLKFKGRIDSTKTQMANSFTYKIGKISSITLTDHIDYVSKTFYTRLGTYNLNIWLYYKCLY